MGDAYVGAGVERITYKGILYDLQGRSCGDMPDLNLVAICPLSGRFLCLKILQISQNHVLMRIYLFEAGGGKEVTFLSCY